MRTRLIHAALLVMSSIALCACEQAPEPQLQPVDPAPESAASTNPSQVSSARSPGDYQRLAEQGDVEAMMLLARSHESLGNKSEARKWYTKAVAAGSDKAKDALANLDAPTPTAQATETPRPATAPLVATAPPRPATSTAPYDSDKLRWQDVLGALDTTGFVTAEQPNVQGRFIGVTTAPDGTITVAASGKTGDEITEVTAVIRIRNRQDPASSPRIPQVGAVAARVTNDNVNQREWLEWVTEYVKTEKKSLPLFRNGWRIIVSGSAAQGIRDKKEHQGMAVMLEMKK
jgi:hypothetical protein